jgi:hypothetical protein
MAYRNHGPGPVNGRLLPFAGARAVFIAPVYSVHMTAPAAVAQFTDGRAIVRSGDVSIGMTACTVGLICGEWPGDYLVVGCVAINAEHAGSVITGIAGRVVPEQN